MCRIYAPRPMYLCEECGSKQRRVNVVDGRVLCRDCTILALRRLDKVVMDNRTDKGEIQ